MAGVVKADAYGLSAAHIAPVLVDQGARLLFTAGFDEAAALPATIPRAVLDGLSPGSERAFLDALERCRSFRIKGNELTLLGEGGATVATFTPGAGATDVSPASR